MASDIPPPAGVNRCPAGFTGAIVWHYDPVERDYDYYNFCIH